jgi:CRP-like cAMP-binding protein
VSIEDDIAFFERVPTLRMLGRTALRILAIGAESRYVHDGEELFKIDEPADGAFVIQEGSFTLTSAFTTGAEQVVAGPGTLLGEMALIAETKRPATAVAREPSTVIRISRSLFLRMLEGYPEAALKLRELLTARAQQSLSDMTSVRAMLDASEVPRR